MVTAAHTPAAPRVSRRGAVLALMAFTQFVVVLNTSIMNVALGPIAVTWQMPPSVLSWVVNAYLLPFGGLLLLGGRLGDLVGHRRMLLIGSVTLTLASGLASVAWSESALLAARAAQGVGASLLVPSALAVTVVLFPMAAERQRALGIIGAVSGFGGAAGVVLSGVFIAALGWRSIFGLTVVLAAAMATAIPMLVRPDVATGQPRRQLDLPGAVLVTLGLTSVVFGLSATRGNGGGTAVAGLALGVVLLVGFVSRQRLAADPLVRRGILRTGAVGPANVLMLLLGALWIGFFFYLPLLQQQVLGYTPLAAGVSQLPLATATVFGSWLASRAAATMGLRLLLVASFGLLAAGLGTISLVSAHASFATALLGPSLLVGLGLGVAFVLLTGLGVAGVEPGESGLASGLINTTRQIGGGLGLALLTAAAGLATGADHPGSAALLEGFRWAMRTGLVIAAAAALTALFTVPVGRDRH